MKTENWNGYTIRFVEKDGEWWAVAKDVATALGYKNTKDAVKRHCKGVAKHDLGVSTGFKTDGLNASQIVEANIIPESDIYRMAFRSDKPEAEKFQEWICEVLKSLRQSIGLEGFQIFQMLDKEHQREAMRKLHDEKKDAVRVDYIKANTITNKAVSIKYGYDKMIKKAEMTPEMLVDRQSILDDVVSLTTFNEKYHLDLSVSDQIYKMMHSNQGKAS